MRLHRFAIISALGAALDVSILTTLVWHGLPTFWANIVSSGVGIGFAFAVSQRRVFVHDGAFMTTKLLGYGLFQLALIPLASALVHALAIGLDGSGWLAALPFGGLPGTPPGRALAAVLAKGLGMPVTLYINFLFMGWLLERRVSLL